MRYFIYSILSISLFITSCGTTSRITQQSEEHTTTSSSTGTKIEEGKASWYGPNFHGKLTANGETYDMHALTAAHRTLPFDSIVRVQNLNNGKTVQVRINDRGPFAKNRIIDLSKKAAQEIDMVGPGTADVTLYLMNGDLKNSRTTDLKVASYTIQLASYSKRSKAENHAQKVDGARVERIQMDGETVYRVYLGTYVDKTKAQAKHQQLQKEGIVGYVKQIQN